MHANHPQHGVGLRDFLNSGDDWVGEKGDKRWEMQVNNGLGTVPNAVGQAKAHNITLNTASSLLLERCRMMISTTGEWESSQKQGGSPLP